MPLSATMNSSGNSGIMDISESENTTGHTPKALWMPIWFRKTTLVAFMVVFTLAWVSLIILWRYDLVNHGIAIEPSSSHYSWTYGPLVLLSIGTALWRQLDYHCKLSQPWRTMRQGPIDSGRSMLLDYISPFQAISFYKALKNGHWSVTASILGFTILKVAMVISTALLVSLPTELSEGIPITTTSAFNDSSLWRSITSAKIPGPAFIYPADAGGAAYQLPSPGPMFDYESVLDGLPDPMGTQDGITFQTIDSPVTKNAPNTISAEVNALIPHIDCEHARTTFYFEPESPDLAAPYVNTYANVSLDSPSCSVGHFASTISIPVCLPLGGNPAMVRVNCSEDFSISVVEDSDFNYPEVIIDSKTPYDLRLAIVAMNDTDCERNGVKWDTTPPKATGTICKIGYNIKQIELVQDLVLGSLQLNIPDHPTSSYQLHNMTGLELGELILSLVIFWDGGGGFPNLMKKALRDPAASPTWYLNQKVLTNTSENILRGIAAQLAQSLLVVPANEIINGTSIYTENRLHIQPIALWGLVASFIILSLLPLAIIFTVPNGVVSQYPGPIAAHAAILACSPSVQKLLTQTGHLRTSEIVRWLDGNVFRTVQNDNGRFEIKALGGAPLFHKSRLADQKPNTTGSQGQNLDTPSERSRTMRPQDLVIKSGTWAPLATRLPIIVLSFILPVISIICLEVLYRQSESTQGFAIRDQNTVPLYTKYPTSAIVLFIATMFNNMDFTISAFAPFTALRSGPTSARVGLLTNLTGEIPIIALYKSFCNKQYGSSLSILASLVGSILSIVASGLWTIDANVHIKQPVISYPTSFSNLTWENSSSSDTETIARLGSIVFGGAHGSDGVWQDLVFPTLSKIIPAKDKSGDSPEGGILNSGTNSSFNLEVPALRPLLDCDSIPRDHFDYKKLNSQHMQFSGVVPLPPHCFGGPKGDRNYAKIGKTNLGIQQGPKWIGWFRDLHLGGWDDDPEKGFSDVGEDAIYYGTGFTQPDSENGCPSVVVIFGYLEPEKPSTANITGFVCSQRIQEVRTQVTFKPDRTGRIKQNNLISNPVPLESSARYLTNGTPGVDSFNYRVEAPFQIELTNWNYGTLQNDEVDSFFEQLVLGDNGTALEAMVGPNNADTLRDSVNRLYKKYMVEVINSPIFERHLTSAESKQQAPFSGTFTTTSSRLKVDFVSKLVLQIMLAVMVILGGLALRLVKLKDTLLRQPFSIASIMGFLSESTLCSSSVMPDGAEWMNEKQLEEALGGHSFRLGWWRETSSEPRLNGRMEGCWRYGIDIGVPRLTEIRRDRMVG